MTAGSPLPKGLDRSLDLTRMRRYLGTCPSIVYPHAFAAAHIRQALEAGAQCGAADILRDAVEEAVSIALKFLFVSTNPIGIPERKSRVEEHFRACGLGTLELKEAGAGGGEAVVSASPFDECWVAAYGRPLTPVNLLAEGYLAAAFAAVAGAVLRSFAAEEIESMAMGAAVSRFRISRRA
jgi:hypothetical protein